MKTNLAILGSTGSIGKQTLEVISAFPSSFNVVAIAAKDEVELIAEQIKKFNPTIVSVVSDAVKEKVVAKLSEGGVTPALSPVEGSPRLQILTGEEGLLKVATASLANMLVVAVPGVMTLVPVLEAIKAGKHIALATKEVLVAAGHIVMKEAANAKVKIYAIDSEHSAIAQCLVGEDMSRVSKLVITASGGAFLKTPAEKLEKMTAKDALKHPTWKMGPKITIDSATLMNKGLEVIEAHYLFGIDYSKIEVVVHPQSIIHSMVEFSDGSVKAQMGAPDMRVPIQYALFGMQRSASHWNRLDLLKNNTLTFEKPDVVRFPCLAHAYEAGKMGGTMPAVLNAANEEAVKLFIKGSIAFPQIAEKVKKVLDEHKIVELPDLQAILEADKWAREEISK
ncbi:MAG: 1-deoxy-D-xylulose-5-phosphate reductoisomerase [Candidatus Margulisiibacteriota bacterium]